jgi:hypothetical protein
MLQKISNKGTLLPPKSALHPQSPAISGLLLEYRKGSLDLLPTVGLSVRPHKDGTPTSVPISSTAVAVKKLTKAKALTPLAPLEAAAAAHRAWTRTSVHPFPVAGFADRVVSNT